MNPAATALAPAGARAYGQVIRERDDRTLLRPTATGSRSPIIRRRSCLLLVAGMMGVTAAPLAHGQSVDTLRLGELQQAAVTHDPRGAQLALLRDQSALRLENLDRERLPSIGLASLAQYQSDITHIALPNAQAPYKDTYDANAGIRLRLVDPTRGARAAVERAQLTESEARVASTVFAQRQAVNDAFFGALLLDGQRRVLDVAIADLEAQVRVVRDRVRAGAALPGDTAMLLGELARRRQTLDEVVSNRDASRAVLALLTGLTIPADASLLAPTLAERVRAARSAIDSLRARPEYAQFAASRNLISARETATLAQERPRLSVFGRTGYGRPGLNMLARQFDTYWLGGIQLEWAPFDWGSGQREREAIALQRQILASDERAFAERLQRAAITDLATIDRLERALVSDDTIVALRERVQHEARLRQGEGVITIAEFVDRDTELQSAQLTQAAHRVELEQARARFLTNIGLEVR